MSLPKSTSHGASFSKGAAFGTTGNDTAAVPNHPVERSTAPDAGKQPCYGAKKRTEYGTPPPPWKPGQVTNAGRDNC